VRISAAVFEKQYAPFSMAEVDIDSPGPGEALVRVVATGVCHTDAITRDGDMPFPPPGTRLGCGWPATSVPPRRSTCA